MAEEPGTGKPLTHEFVQFPHSRPWILWTVGSLAILALASSLVAGHAMRERSGISGDMQNYQRSAFGMRHERGYMQGNRVISGATGTVGGIVSVTGNTLTIRVNGADQSVALAQSTSFYRNGTIAKQTDLQAGDIVSVVGTPNNAGVIGAVSVSIR